jgi:hypothetical protein
LTRVLNDYGKKNNLIRKNGSLTWRCLEGLTAVISVKLKIAIWGATNEETARCGELFRCDYKISEYLEKN